MLLDGAALTFSLSMFLKQKKGAGRIQTHTNLTPGDSHTSGLYPIRCGSYELQGRRPFMEDSVLIAPYVDLLFDTAASPARSLSMPSPGPRELSEVILFPASRGLRLDAQSHLALPETSSPYYQQLYRRPLTVTCTLGVFCVFDGHSGRRASDFASKHLYPEIVSRWPASVLVHSSVANYNLFLDSALQFAGDSDDSDMAEDRDDLFFNAERDSTTLSAKANIQSGPLAEAEAEAVEGAEAAAGDLAMKDSELQTATHTKPSPTPQLPGLYPRPIPPLQLPAQGDGQEGKPSSTREENGLEVLNTPDVSAPDASKGVGDPGDPGDTGDPGLQKRVCASEETQTDSAPSSKKDKREQKRARKLARNAAKAARAARAGKTDKAGKATKAAKAVKASKSIRPETLLEGSKQPPDQTAAEKSQRMHPRRRGPTLDRPKTKTRYIGSSQLPVSLDLEELSTHIADAFRAVDERFLMAARQNGYADGSTCVMVLLLSVELVDAAEQDGSAWTSPLPSSGPGALSHSFAGKENVSMRGTPSPDGSILPPDSPRSPSVPGPPGTAFLITANAGDSRAVLCRAGVAIELSRDHKPGSPRERRRIEAAGGSVHPFYIRTRDALILSGPDRVFPGGLSVSRGFGDLRLKDDEHLANEAVTRRLVTAHPEISVLELPLDPGVDPRVDDLPPVRPQVSSSPSGGYPGGADVVSSTVDPSGGSLHVPAHPRDLFVLLACDGLWDVMSSQQAIDYAILILAFREVAIYCLEKEPQNQSYHQLRRVQEAGGRQSCESAASGASEVSAVRTPAVQAPAVEAPLTVALTVAGCDRGHREPSENQHTGSVEGPQDAHATGCSSQQPSHIPPSCSQTGPGTLRNIKKLALSRVKAFFSGAGAELGAILHQEPEKLVPRLLATKAYALGSSDNISLLFVSLRERILSDIEAALIYVCSLGDKALGTFDEEITVSRAIPGIVGRESLPVAKAEHSGHSGHSEHSGPSGPSECSPVPPLQALLNAGPCIVSPENQVLFFDDPLDPGSDWSVGTTAVETIELWNRLEEQGVYLSDVRRRPEQCGFVEAHGSVDVRIVDDLDEMLAPEGALEHIVDGVEGRQ